MILTLVDYYAAERASFEKEFVDFFNRERILIFAVRYISAVMCKYFCGVPSDYVKKRSWMDFFVIIF